MEQLINSIEYLAVDYGKEELISYVEKNNDLIRGMTPADYIFSSVCVLQDFETLQLEFVDEYLIDKAKEQHNFIVDIVNFFRYIQRKKPITDLYYRISENSSYSFSIGSYDFAVIFEKNLIRLEILLDFSRKEIKTAIIDLNNMFNDKNNISDPYTAVDLYWEMIS